MADTFEAWRRYASVGAIDDALLRPHIAAAWKRVHERHLSPWRPRAEMLENSELERLLERQSAFVRAAKPYVSALSRAAGAERHASMLSDDRGVVLDVVGDEQSVRGPESVPAPGALLSEEYCGSNGIGTPLAEQRYSELVGPEHFISGFHPFTCQGIPVRDAEGSVRGALSLSVRRQEAADRLRDMLICAAHGIQAELLHLKLRDDIGRVLADPAGGGVPLAALRDDVVQAHTAGRMQLETASLAASRNRLEYAYHLLALAEQALERFHLRAVLWRELSAPDVARPSREDLGAILTELVDMLQTEAGVRQVALELVGVEPCPAQVDRRSFGRALLSFLVDALAVAGEGGRVRVELVRWQGGTRGRIRASAMDREGRRLELAFELSYFGRGVGDGE